MNNKKGFTLVELLGVIVVLAIIMGLAIIGYGGIRNSIKSNYYQGLEVNILASAKDYFDYNGYNVIFTNQNRKVYLNTLVEDKYIDNIVDQNGQNCDLNNSFVLTYKNDDNKTSYVVCLYCSDYEPNNDLCNS